MQHTVRAFVLVFASLSVVTGCHQSSPGHGGSGGSGGSGSGGGSGGSGSGPDDMAVAGPGNDFPGTPIIDPTGGTPSGAPGAFGGAPVKAADTPCVSDPQDGALVPQNWLRPRFSYAAANQNLFEIRLHTDGEVNDLVVYTSQTTWTMDKAMWQGVVAHSVDKPITYSIRGGHWDGSKLDAGPSTAATGTFTVAPVSAPGAIVYWAQQTATQSTALRGFTFGEEIVHDVIKPSQVSASTQCVACHSSTPDGSFVGFSWTATADNGDPAQVGMLSSDGNLTTPSFVKNTAALARTQEFPVYSKAHWQTGDHMMISMLYVGPYYDIEWTDLEATTGGTGRLDRTGDPGQAGGATWSHDGNHVVYASGSTVASGYQMTDGDIRVIPYNNHAGGTSTAVAGASEPNFNEYFPTYSPDDQFIAFTRLPTGSKNYTPTNAPAEVLVVPAAGAAGTVATRLAANDPPACTKRTSPGVTNSWPKWAPDVVSAGTRKFYWLTFSSKRVDGATPQLFVTPFVVDNGVVKTYPALYLWNQPANEGNHTPAWDNFAIPIS